MDWTNDPATQEIALKVIVAFLTALLAALGVSRQGYKTRAEAQLQTLNYVERRASHLDAKLQTVRTNLATVIDEKHALAIENSEMSMMLAEPRPKRSEPKWPSLPPTKGE